MAQKIDCFLRSCAVFPGSPLVSRLNLEINFGKCGPLLWWRHASLPWLGQRAGACVGCFPWDEGVASLGVWRLA